MTTLKKIDVGSLENPNIPVSADNFLHLMGWGDLKTRMEAHATAIQNGIKTPNEVRDLEELEPRQNGDDLLIQGATVPIANQMKEAEDQN